MIETRRIEGIVPVVQTPLNADGSLDIPAQKRLMRRLIEKDVAAFWCLGTGSEDMNLTFEKRLAAAEAVCSENAGEMPLVLGAGFFCMEDSLNFMDATQNLTFDAYHVMPYHPLLGLDRMKWWYERLADAAPKPLWMYTSANWCQHIGPEFVDALKHHPNIAGIKYSSSHTVNQLKVLEMQRPDFQVITAVANQWYAAIAMGSRAGTSSMASVLPEPLTEIMTLYLAGEHNKALDAQHQLMNFLSALPKTIKKDNFLGGAEEKYMLSLLGICQPHMTDYYRELNEDEQEQVRAALRGSGYDRYIPC